jgi:hypothetical protein
MNERNSQLVINSFEVITRNNFKLTYALSQHLHISLHTGQADADINKLYQYYEPIHNHFHTIYSRFYGRVNNIAGSTVKKKDINKALTQKINEWDLDILNFVKARTHPDYKALMNGGHTSFITGSYFNKTLRVQILSATLKNYPSLATTKTNVDAFLEQMDAANTAKNNANMNAKHSSINAESARIAVCNGMQYVLGGLYQKYCNDLAPVARFFDLHQMKQHRQQHFQGSHLHPKAIRKIMKRTLRNNQYLLLSNRGNTVLRFYTASFPKGNNDNYIELAPHTEQKVAATSLGNFATHKYVMVFNTDELNQGSWEVEIGVEEKEGS